MKDIIKKIQSIKNKRNLKVWRERFSFQMRQRMVHIMTRSSNWSYHVLVKVVSVRLSSYALMWVYDYVTRNFIDYNILTFLSKKKKTY